MSPSISVNPNLSFIPETHIHTKEMKEERKRKRKDGRKGRKEGRKEKTVSSPIYRKVFQDRIKCSLFLKKEPIHL